MGVDSFTSCTMDSDHPTFKTCKLQRAVILWFLSAFLGASD